MLDNKIGYMICETSASPTETTPISDSNGRLVAEGILQDMNVKNRNGRFYDSRDLSPEVNGSRMKELIDAKQFKGECGHPLSKDIARQQTIDPSMVCVNYLKVWVDGNDIKSHFKGTNNDLGQAFDADLREGCKPAFSLRALGTIENTRRGAEVKNCRIVTWDHVIYPSHNRAYTTNIVSNVNESAGIISSSNNEAKQGNKLFVDESYNGLLTPITNAKVIDYLKHESGNIKTMMESFDLLYNDMTIIDEGRKIQITDKVGGIFIVNLEHFVQNEIMNYCESLI